MDLEALYDDAILRHSRRSAHEGDLSPHTHAAEGYNPICGDRIRVFLRLGDERLEAIRFAGEGCAISRASASIMAESVEGMDGAALAARVESVLARLREGSDARPGADESPELAALLGVRRFPARVGCAALPWRAVAAALERGAETAGT